MTSQGSLYARFRRALGARDAFGASAAALELHHVGLADALELTLIYLDSEPTRYERALRWHGRLCLQQRATKAQLRNVTAARENQAPMGDGGYPPRAV